jgi:hypothetical protein
MSVGFLFGDPWNSTVHQTNCAEPCNQLHPLVAQQAAVVTVVQ